MHNLIWGDPSNGLASLASLSVLNVPNMRIVDDEESARALPLLSVCTVTVAPVSHILDIGYRREAWLNSHTIWSAFMHYESTKRRRRTQYIEIDLRPDFHINIVSSSSSSSSYRSDDFWFVTTTDKRTMKNEKVQYVRPSSCEYYASLIVIME